MSHLDSALKKVKSAQLTPKEASALADWLAQSVGNRVCEHTGLSSSDWSEAVDEIEETLLTGKK